MRCKTKWRGEGKEEGRDEEIERERMTVCSDVAYSVTFTS